MDVSLECIYCTLKKIDALYDKHEIDKVKKLEFMKEVFKIISMSESGDTSPYLSTRIMRRLDSELNLGDIYYDIKKEYNTLLVSMEKEILSIIYASDDKLLTALKYAMVGNFIDFGAMDKVDIDELKNLIYKAPKQKINIMEYENFVKEMMEWKC